MSEKALASRVMKILKPLDAIRIENMCSKGTPDVNYIGGWIELKQQDNWPKRDSTKVRLDHDLTLEQRIWLERRAEKGGATWVLLQVSRDYLLFKGPVAAQVIGEATKAELCEAAYRVWTNNQFKKELLECLQHAI